MARDWDELEAWRRREKMTPGTIRNILAWLDLNKKIVSSYNNRRVVLWQATTGQRGR